MDIVTQVVILPPPPGSLPPVVRRISTKALRSRRHHARGCHHDRSSLRTVGNPNLKGELAGEGALVGQDSCYFYRWVKRAKSDVYLVNIKKPIMTVLQQNTARTPSCHLEKPNGSSRTVSRPHRRRKPASTKNDDQQEVSAFVLTPPPDKACHIQPFLST